MAYCVNCKIRPTYDGVLCYECKQHIGTHTSMPHGTITYNKYNPEMSKIPKSRRKERKLAELRNIQGVPLTHEMCANYILIYWKCFKDKPDIDLGNAEFCTIRVKPYSK